VYKVLAGKPEERDYSEYPGVDGRIVLIYIATIHELSPQNKM
jgi:hypothetical protein